MTSRAVTAFFSDASSAHANLRHDLHVLSSIHGRRPSYSPAPPHPPYSPTTWQQLGAVETRLHRTRGLGRSPMPNRRSAELTKSPAAHTMHECDSPEPPAYAVGVRPMFSTRERQHAPATCAATQTAASRCGSPARAPVPENVFTVHSRRRPPITNDVGNRRFFRVKDGARLRQRATPPNRLHGAARHVDA